MIAGSKFYSPGSVFRAQTDPKNPLCWGLPREINVFFDSGQPHMALPLLFNALYPLPTAVR